MSNLRRIHDLLREEYPVSRYRFWLNEESQVVVSDVTFALRLIVQATQRLRHGEQVAWERLLRYCLDRAMSPVLLQAIDAYLRPCGDFPPLPLIDLTQPKPRNWRGTSVPLLDETDRLSLTAPTEKPEPERALPLKGSHQWSHALVCLKDTPPQPASNPVRSHHWLY